jgi:CheY-like chemotaxis protein
MPPQQASILIVDDELSVRDSLLHWFRKDGFNVATAASATLALQALEQGPTTSSCSTSRCPAWTAWSCSRASTP